MTDKPMPVDLLAWKALNKGAMKGIADVQIGALKVFGVMVFRSNDKGAWAMLPTKPSLNADGTIYRGTDGKPKYISLMEWASRDARDRFSAGVVAAIERFNPGATE